MLASFGACLCLISTFLSLSNAFYSSPVLLWGVDSTNKPKPVFTLFKQENFANLMRPFLKTHMIVAFLENDLTAKDFLCLNAQTKLPCFMNMRDAYPKAYYAAVQQPVEALQTLMVSPTRHAVLENGQLEQAIDCQANSIKIIEFSDNLPTREEQLTKHDAIIDEIAMQLQCPVVYLYMSNTASIDSGSKILKRMRRQEPEEADESEETEDEAEEAEPGGSAYQPSAGQLLKGENLILYFLKIGLRDNAKLTPLTVTDLDEQTSSDTKISVTLHTDIGKPITFDVETVGGYNVIDRFFFNNISYHVQYVEAPLKFSYACSSLTSRHMATTLEWTNLQFQVRKAKEEFKGFKEAWHCTGFVSTGIISGLFVMTLLLSVMFYAICWIMDINSVDRFEDPKGKSIHIAASG